MAAERWLYHLPWRTKKETYTEPNKIKQEDIDGLTANRVGHQLQQKGASLAPEVCELGERLEHASETTVTCRETARGTSHA
mmetsp:Transcript_17612/g.48359  ORF Transcript_17612/g.48359 Transcript_17612/m.48359 type:complete len:81 (+) Transcript_17612:156-398(+)